MYQLKFLQGLNLWVLAILMASGLTELLLCFGVVGKQLKWPLGFKLGQLLSHISLVKPKNLKQVRKDNCELDNSAMVVVIMKKRSAKLLYGVQYKVM